MKNNVTEPKSNYPITHKIKVTLFTKQKIKYKYVTMKIYDLLLLFKEIQMM